jgi:tetratricopeptide (TPR) repeat protein
MKIKKILLMLLLPALLLIADDSNELAKRYIKLGNTYREAGNFSNAASYLKKGINILEKETSWDSRYWLAVAHEFYAYFYNDMNMTEEAKNEFKKAYALYYELISMNGGSDDAIKEAELNMKKIDEIIAGKTDLIESDLKIASYDDMNLRSAPGNIPAKIENLSLKDNKLRDFDYVLLNLNELKYLDLSDNKIRDLPNAQMLKNIDKLLWLDLSNNKLKRADISALCVLKNLAVLDLSGNEIDFNQIKNLIQCLPNTRIIHDEYELSDD